MSWLNWAKPISYSFFSAVKVCSGVCWSFSNPLGSLLLEKSYMNTHKNIDLLKNAPIKFSRLNTCIYIQKKEKKTQEPT